MKLKAVLLGLLPALALVPALARAAPGDGIQGTLHDWSGAGAPTFVGAGLCTFCHTPHKANSTLLLWNHTLSQNNFSWDVPETTAGTTFPTIAGQTYKGNTAKCLSCHDGSVAVNSRMPKVCGSGFQSASVIPEPVLTLL